MIYECIIKIISKERKKKILIHHNEYNIVNPVLSSGMCILKIVIHDIHLYSNATTNMIQAKLSNVYS